MFNDKYGLTQAVLEGRKTQTRRIAYDFRQHVGQKVDKCVLLQNNNITYMDGEIQVIDELPKPHYEVGEVVAIAQNYKEAGCDFYFHRGLAGWKNKMFVKAALMPHRIKITNIRVERLQDISEEDCLNEGISVSSPPLKYMSGYWTHHTDNFKMFDIPRKAFAALIDKVSGKGTWESNPWVFVYDFELIK